VTIDPLRRYGNLLRADGTNQLQRLLPGLDSDYIVPDERSLSDLVEYAYRVAQEIRFFDLSGQSTGDWSPFFEPLVDLTTGRIRTREIETLLNSRADWPPHLVLFLTYLKLFQHLQGDLNQLPEKHLRHYYEKELGLPRRAALSDDAHVIFTLAQNSVSTLLPVGTLLDAGKDAQGRPLRYATQTELVVSPATVATLRRLVVERDLSGNRRFFLAEDFTELEGPAGYTFGRRQLDLDPTQRFMREAALGFAVAAPILNLAEGARQVTVLAHLRAPPSPPSSPPPPALITQGISFALDVALTGAEGWLTPDTFQATLLADGGSGQPAVSLTFTLSEAAPAVIPFDSALHGPGLITNRPVLRCRVRGDSGIHKVLDGFSVERIELAVDVKGVRNLIVQNDEATFATGQPVPLFGSRPAIGAPFYIGSAEAFTKKLTSLSLQLEWKSPPAELFDHYRAYFDVVDNFLTDNFYTVFLADLDLLYERSFRRLLVNQTLFSPVTTEPRKITALSSVFDAALTGLEYVEQPDLDIGESFRAGNRAGFVRLVLTQPRRGDLAAYAQAVPFEAFGHPIFAPRYAHQAIALANWSPPAVKPLLPNEPYTPTLSTLSLDYTATSELVPGDKRATGAYFVIGPFGATRAEDREGARLVPSIEDEAALFLGIGNLEPPGNLSLFFQIDVGTATAKEVLKPGDTEWSYLDVAESWRKLNPGSVLIDSTQGFQRPGLVSISVPREAAPASQSMPAGLVWLRAQIRRPPESAARTLAVRANATLARFQPGDVPLNQFEQHLHSGLPAGTITRLLQRNSDIARVEQPSASFGGRGEEGGTEFFRRCSERLRHRNRAVTGWDLERLVLERFPEVFKVKCLPHTDATGANEAGNTALVIVPNLRRAGSTNVLEPRASEVLLGEISEYLEGLAPAFATIHVIRPVFERIRVEAQVAFARGRDPGYFTAVLNEDLRRFLSPWAYQDGEDILFGARIYRSEILAFIEGREYVDHLTGLRLYHSFDGVKREGIGFMTIGLDFFVRPDPKPGIAEMKIGADFVVGRGIEVAETTQAHAILVSHPDHLITPVTPGTETCAGVTRLGIGYMTVGLDFNVQPELL
jgi:hypothetical protein